MPEELPPRVMTIARNMLDEALHNPAVCPRPGSFFGWWVQANTDACAKESGYDLSDIYDGFRREGYQVLGDPADGAFISMAPVEVVGLGDSSPSLGRAVETVRFPLALGEKVARKVEKKIQRLTKAVILVGSVGRKQPDIGDVDFVVLPKNLKAFDLEIREMGFTGGAQMRIYRKVVDGIKVELYLAHKPDEMGSMIFHYMGDNLLNIAQRWNAKKMDLRLNQYGLWKGDKLVFQSTDERDFWDYLGMEYQTPEERSLAQRGAPRATMSGYSMGAEELIEMGANEGKTLYKRWADGEIIVDSWFRGTRAMVAVREKDSHDKEGPRYLVEWLDKDVMRLFENGTFLDDSSFGWNRGRLGQGFEASVVEYAEQAGVPAYPR